MAASEQVRGLGRCPLGAGSRSRWVKGLSGKRLDALAAVSGVVTGVGIARELNSGVDLLGKVLTRWWKRSEGTVVVVPRSS